MKWVDLDSRDGEVGDLKAKVREVLAYVDELEAERFSLIEAGRNLAEIVTLYRGRGYPVGKDPDSALAAWRVAVENPRN